MHDYQGPALVTLGVLVLLFVAAANVGRARGKYKIEAPATTGHPEFERIFRVQMNTVENTVLFLPALWLFAFFLSATWATIIGGAWLAARVWYAAAYQREASKRGPGFGLSMLAFVALALGAAWGVIRGFF